MEFSAFVIFFIKEYSHVCGFFPVLAKTYGLWVIRPYGWAYIVSNEANSHLPKVHLPASKRKITSEGVGEEQGKLEQVEVGEEN